MEKEDSSNLKKGLIRRQSTADVVHKRLTFSEEVADISRQAAPNFLAGMSYVLVKTVDTALIGHTGTGNLSAVSWTQIWILEPT